MTRPLKKIALVEDDHDIATLTAMALGQIGGFEIVHYSSGAEALEGLRQSPPDLVLLDYSMPAMTGDEVLIALRHDPATAQIPAIFMTASVMPGHVQRLRELGALAVFSKPFDPIGLADRIRAVWDEAGL